MVQTHSASVFPCQISDPANRDKVSSGTVFKVRFLAGIAIVERVLP